MKSYPEDAADGLVFFLWHTTHDLDVAFQVFGWDMSEHLRTEVLNRISRCRHCRTWTMKLDMRGWVCKECEQVQKIEDREWQFRHTLTNHDRKFLRDCGIKWEEGIEFTPAPRTKVARQHRMEFEGEKP